ncbi:GGDEF domain-containing protein [Campylobacter sp. RM12640]|uniref:GGDEF domain-containing protein n=1 Tax=unclassified Campylobacter TaxID=2593542 RepID=UPI001BD948E9|nr:MULTISPECIES: GGDEF domain-containing protein [unclassified Campylobacter]MBZ7977125.1 GGDEF domain-containing protein [Campylobacter sp. RM12637]MBZ7982637.1 GGDEF domain-containing protein [Campylobacter sp. RM12640]MBZ7984488.1 GGDEF domain-containing protein [Campylobacter sp. RM12647]MBZ7989832.1 GGDEF domain-containing protein [Campylobacter sp. RM12635]MBZ7990896.1 GGDEF domain-containing protein [Campylobacter sp. RM9331]MBZ7993812.1 GGDEF domain-containing protein [Campylobacter s
MNSFLSELIISLPSATFILEILALIIALYFKKYNIISVCILLISSKMIYLFSANYQTHIYVSLFMPFAFALLVSLKKEYDTIKCLLPISFVFILYIVLGIFLSQNTSFALNSTNKFLFSNSFITDLGLVFFLVFLVYLLILRFFIFFEKTLIFAYIGAYFEFMFFKTLEKTDVGFFEFASLIFLISIFLEGYKLAFFDALTQVLNRRAYDRTRLIANDVIAVCDIDFFKKVNDTYGHDAGDFILKNVAKILKANVDKVYRFGGEEFVIVYKNQDFKNCVTKLDNIRENIEKEIFKFNEKIIKVTISIGVEMVEDDKIKAFKNADAKLYKAKNSGRNRVIYE